MESEKTIMAASVKHLRESDYVVSEWSGGKTIQLAIAPVGAVYADRDFLWRLSSATVELAESDFTPLPDYNRLIAPLKGDMRLCHNGGAAFDLEPFQIYAFDGGADTHSWGCCTDFNLMLRKGHCTGRAEHLHGDAGETLSFAPAAGAELLFYCAVGEAEVTAEGETITLQEKESVYVPCCGTAPVTIRCNSSADLMAAEITHQ